MEGYFGTVAYQLETAGRYLPFKPCEIWPGVAGWLLAPLVFASRAAFKVLAEIDYRVDDKSRFTRMGFHKNYVAIARKRA